MAKQFVSDLAPNAAVDSIFAVKDKSLAAFRNKPGKFLNLTLSDHTGEVKARAWDNAQELAAGFDVGDVVAVEGRVDEYQGQLQVITASIAKVEPGGYDPADLMAHSDKSPQELLSGLDAVVAQVTDPHLRALLDAFVSDADFRECFAAAHGSKSLHHSYAGGLLEHTLCVVEIAKTVAALHPEINRDLLITGSILHDIGKLEELEGAITVTYSDVGHLIGHTVLTDRMVGAKLALIEDFPAELAKLLSHALLSHHGERDWGAPVVPMTMEACALHYADNLDARVQGFKQVIRDAGESSAHWSEYHRSYQRFIYLGSSQDEADDL